MADERFLAKTELAGSETENTEEEMAKYSYILISIFLAQILFCCCMVMVTGARVHNMERELVRE